MSIQPLLAACPQGLPMCLQQAAGDIKPSAATVNISPSDLPVALASAPEQLAIQARRRPPGPFASPQQDVGHGFM